MDMNKLFADFTEYVSSMTSQQVRQSLSDAMLHSMDSDKLLTAEELPEMSMENTPRSSSLRTRSKSAILRMPCRF